MGERQRLPCQVGSVLQNTACSMLYAFLRFLCLTWLGVRCSLSKRFFTVIAGCSKAVDMLKLDRAPPRQFHHLHPFHKAIMKLPLWSSSLVN